MDNVKQFRFQVTLKGVDCIVRYLACILYACVTSWNLHFCIRSFLFCCYRLSLSVPVQVNAWKDSFLKWCTTALFANGEWSPIQLLTEHK